MKSMEQLQKAYEKENRLAEQHKKNAMEIKKQMELTQNKNISQKVNSLNMSGAEYDRFMKLLSSGKKTIFEAVELVLGSEATLPPGNDENEANSEDVSNEEDSLEAEEGDDEESAKEENL